MKVIRERVLNREIMLGIGANLGSNITVEMVGAAGFDWTWIDYEHGAGNDSQLLTQIQVASLGDAPPVVRIAWNEAPRFKRVLDLGASGIMVPYVNTKEEAVLAAKSMRYPPEGIRGVAMSPRACGYGRNFDDYYASANNNLLTVVQIETAEAVRNADEIASVAGVDVLFVGPLDLSVNMGMVRQFDNPTYVEALKKVASACERHKKAAGILVPKQDFLPRWIDMGYTFFVVGSDGGFVANGLANLKSFCETYK